MRMTEQPRIQRLAPSDLATVAALYAEEAPALPPGFLRRRSGDELLAYLDGSEGQAFGLFHGRALRAVGLLRLPRRGAFAGQPPFPYVPPADWPQRTAFGECVVVRAALRGRGYQRLLIKARLAAAEAAGRRWFCAGVHADNAASWHNLLKSGFVMVGCREQPAPARLGFLKPLNGSSLPLRPETLCRVGLGDLAGHLAALGAGLIGAAIDHTGRVLYRTPVRAAAFARVQRRTPRESAAGVPRNRRGGGWVAISKEASSMQPKLPADHPTASPDFEPTPADRRDLVEPRPTVEEEIALRDESAPPPVIERLAEDLAAAASPLVPEAGVAEGSPSASTRRNRALLIATVIAAVAALAVLLVLAN